MELGPADDVDLAVRLFTHGIVPGPAAGRVAVGGVAAPGDSSDVRRGHRLVVAGGCGGDLDDPQWRIGAVVCRPRLRGGGQIPIYLMRSSAFTALELAQTLRYLPDLVTVLALLAWLSADLRSNRLARVAGPLTTRTRSRGSGRAASWPAVSSRPDFPVHLAGQRYSPTWARLESLAQAHRKSDAALLDPEVDPLVLGRVAYPENLASHLFALIPGRPEFGRYTTQLRMLDVAGRLVDANVTWVRTISPGPQPNCGYFVQPDAPSPCRLDGPLLPAEWTAEINYLANTDGTMLLSHH